MSAAGVTYKWPMQAFTTDALASLAEEEGLLFGRDVLAQIVAALDAGKHVMLTGAPGTGKTSLAYLAAELARRSLLGAGYLAVTASNDWGIAHTIGRYADTPDGQVFQPGFFLQALDTGEWLVIDEFNRADFDRAFGPLFTVMADKAVTLPFKRVGHTFPISIVPTDIEAPADTEPVRIPQSWRMISTMNEFDKQTLFRLSYALMRRFAFIEVESPSEEGFRSLLAGPGEMVADLLGIRKFIDLGPAVFIDAARYAARRSADPDVTRSRVLFETFYAYLLPQLDRLGDLGDEMLEEMSAVFDPAELVALRRVVRNLLSGHTATGDVGGYAAPPVSRVRRLA